MFAALCHVKLWPQRKFHFKYQISIKDSLTKKRFFVEFFAGKNVKNLLSLFVKSIFLNLHSNINIDRFI